MENHLACQGLPTPELYNIRSILVENGYPEFLIDSRISKKLFHFHKTPKKAPKMSCLFKITMDWRKFPEIWWKDNIIYH